MRDEQERISRVLQELNAASGGPYSAAIEGHVARRSSALPSALCRLAGMAVNDES
jgi:hypothetical protein